MSEGFFNRWSRRKLQPGALADPEPPAGAGRPGGPGAPTPAAQARAAAAATAPEGPPAAQPQTPAAPRDPAQRDPAQPEPPLPTLDDVQALTPASDFQPFMRPGVGPQVRNAAMKKLFADPHFNVMDGLDIYIDDYSQPDPLPAGMLRRMASAQFLQLVPEETPEQPGTAQDPLDPAVAPDPAMRQVVAQSPLPPATAPVPDHDHPDLQLQPDPAPSDPSPESRPG